MRRVRRVRIPFLRSTFLPSEAGAVRSIRFPTFFVRFNLRLSLFREEKLCIRILLNISCLVFMRKSHLNQFWKKQNSKARKRAPGENRIHDHPSSSSDAPTNELLEALWRAGSKFTSNYNYNSHSNIYTKLTTSYLRFVSDKNFILWKLSQWPNLCEEYQKNKLHV